MFVSIMNEVKALNGTFGENVIKAAIAQQYEIDDGIEDVDAIVDSADPQELEEATDELLTVLEKFNEKLGYDAVEKWMYKYMHWLGAKRQQEGNVATTIKHSQKNSAVATIPKAASMNNTANVGPAKTTAEATAKTAKAQTQPRPVVAASMMTTVPTANTMANAVSSAASPTALQNVQAVQTSASSNTQLNYASFIPDDWECGTDKWDDFMRVADDIAKTEVVYTHDEDMLASGIDIDPIQPNLHIESIIDSPIQAAQFAQKMQSQPDIVLSTMRGHGGTGLALEMSKGRMLPIGQSAMDGVCARAGFTRDGFERHMAASEEDAARELNGQFRHGRGSVTLIESCGKIRAMNSDRFAYGKIADIMKVFEAFWKKNYPNAVVQAMYFSHTQAYWELNLSAYRDDIFNGFDSLIKSGYNPVLEFATSNTANAAFRIVPGLEMPGGTVIPLCDKERGIRVRHSGSGNYTERVNALMQQIVNSYSNCKAMLSNAAENMEKLKKMQVKNASNALLRELDEIGFPRKQGREAAENFSSFYGSNLATGFDCFIAVANAYSFFVRDNPGNKQQQFECAMRVGRAAACDWEALGNIPGEYKGY